jgi:hypothetical protein
MATPAPTPTFSPAFLAQDVTSSVLAAAIPTFALATIGVTLRIFARRLTAAKFWWDDYLIFISYVRRHEPRALHRLPRMIDSRSRSHDSNNAV